MQQLSGECGAQSNKNTFYWRRELRRVRTKLIQNHPAKLPPAEAVSRYPPPMVAWHVIHYFWQCIRHIASQTPCNKHLRLELSKFLISRRA
jgi:hypothetical protein